MYVYLRVCGAGDTHRGMKSAEPGTEIGELSEAQQVTSMGLGQHLSGRCLAMRTV